MKEGVNQGCPLSAIFAAFVLDRVLQPLDKLLQERAKARLENGDLGDDSMGSITNISAWVDDVYGAIPLVDLKFTCSTIRELAAPLLLILNVHKTRILTSTYRASIIPRLAEVNPSLAIGIKATIAEFLERKNPIDGKKTIPVELMEGFCLLGTPVGSPRFAQEFFEERLAEVRQKVKALEKGVPNLQTCLRIFL